MGLIGALADDYVTLTCVKQHPNSALPGNQEHLSQQMQTFPPQRKTCETNTSPPHCIMAARSNDKKCSIDIFHLTTMVKIKKRSRYIWKSSIVKYIHVFCCGSLPSASTLRTIAYWHIHVFRIILHCLSFPRHTLHLLSAHFIDQGRKVLWLPLFFLNPYVPFFIIDSSSLTLCFVISFTLTHLRWLIAPLCTI